MWRARYRDRRVPAGTTRARDPPAHCHGELIRRCGSSAPGAGGILWEDRPWRGRDRPRGLSEVSDAVRKLFIRISGIRAVRALSQSENLAGDEIEERRSRADFDERFGGFEPHTCSETAIELDDHRPGEELIVAIRWFGAFDLGQHAHGLDLLPAEGAGVAGEVSFQVMSEGGDGGIGQTGGLHFGGKR